MDNHWIFNRSRLRCALLFWRGLGQEALLVDRACTVRTVDASGCVCERWSSVPHIDPQNGKSNTVSPSGTVSDGNLNSDTVSINNRNSAKHRLEQCSVYCQTPFRATMGTSPRQVPGEALCPRVASALSDSSGYAFFSR